MKKLSLIVTLLFAALLFQECRKDTYTAEASSTFYLLAIINDTTWTTDTISASVNYSQALAGKVFSFTGTGTYKKIFFSIYQHAAGPTTGLPLATYNINDSVNTDGTKNVAAFYTGQKVNGTYNFTQQGTVYANSGSLIITAIDSVKKTITGTFSFFSRSNTYDSDGNITSTTINQVQAGGFNNLPYTFSSN